MKINLIRIVLLFLIFPCKVNAQKHEAHFGLGVNGGVTTIVDYTYIEYDYSDLTYSSFGLMEFVQYKTFSINFGQEIFELNYHHDGSTRYGLDAYEVFSKHIQIPIGFDFKLSKNEKNYLFLRLAYVADFIYYYEQHGDFRNFKQKKFTLDSHNMEIGPGVVFKLTQSLKFSYSLTLGIRRSNDIVSHEFLFTSVKNKIGLLYIF